ncbi:MAG TPA: peptidase S8 and S53 subtilisin kexin sedolisin [Clostridium sp.]|nr:peptidase S8 and S53 subtilisin kexin sedolisin [Clostridium sp.]
MADSNNLFYDPRAQNHLIEYRGNFLEQMSKVDYAVGSILNEALGIIAVYPENINRLLNDVPAIIYIDFRAMFVLEDIAPDYVDKINSIKINPYLGLNGSGVTVGIVDSGIDYLNNEFINEDDTSRILAIWDQSIENTSDDPDKPYIGTVYTNEQINAAIQAKLNNNNPYDIVPSRDERGHGTKVAGIIGAKGNGTGFKGVADRCNFIIVKLFESSNFKKRLEGNQIGDVAVYNNSEIVAGLEFLKQQFFKLTNKAMVIYMGIGGTNGSHDGANLISRYVSSLGMNRGMCLVTGVGNEGDAQGHAVGFLKYKGDKSVQELKVPREVKMLTVDIWIQKPNKASVNIISPTDESSSIIVSKLNKSETSKFVFTETEYTVSFRTPDHFTGHDLVQIVFKDIKPGIWKIMLVGEYVINGRYDIWLPPHSVIPEGLVFLTPTSDSTITLPSTSTNVISVGHLGENNVIVSSSGRGFTTNGNSVRMAITPMIATIGENIITTDVNEVNTTMTGSSAAAAIVAGGCALLLQWGIVKGNDPTMYSKKVISYLEYSAVRNPLYKYPNKETGYGEFNLLGVFNVIGRLFKNAQLNRHHRSIGIEVNEFGDYEYYVDNLFIRVPKNCIGEFVCKEM